MNAQIMVENLKCNGCATTIKKELAQMNGISSVVVDIETARIDVGFDETLPLTAIKQKLTSLGYPEANTVHGISKVAANAKSYVSCAVGKFS